MQSGHSNGTYSTVLQNSAPIRGGRLPIRGSRQGGGDRVNQNARTNQNHTSANNSQYNGLVNQVQTLRKAVEDDVHGLDALALRLEDVESDISHESGMRNKIKAIQKDISALKAEKTVLSVDGESATYLESRVENFQLHQEIQDFRLETLVGIVDRQQRQIDSLKLSNASGLAASLIDNVVIGGIRHDPAENCHDAAAMFFIHKMNLYPQQADILYAERLGEGIKKGNLNFPPLLKVRCSPYFRGLVWSNRQCLKGQCDPQFRWKYFVDLQKPDVFRAANTRYRATINEMIENNKGKEPKDQQNPKIRGTKLFVNGEILEDPAHVPTPKELFSLDLLQRDSLDEIPFDESNSCTLSSSTFKAFSTPVSSYRQVHQAYMKIKLDHLYATHIIMACAFLENGKLKVFNCDDGEDGAGNELEKLMKEESFTGYVLFIVRWKLGSNLGPRRFKCILAVASDVIKKAKMKEEIRNQLSSQPQNQTPPQQSMQPQQPPQTPAPLPQCNSPHSSPEKRNEIQTQEESHVLTQQDEGN